MQISDLLFFVNYYKTGGSNYTNPQGGSVEGALGNNTGVFDDPDFYRRRKLVQCSDTIITPYELPRKQELVGSSMVQNSISFVCIAVPNQPAALSMMHRQARGFSEGC